MLMRKVALGILAVAVLSGVVALSAASVAVYTQPHNGSGTLYHSSRWEPDGSDYDQLVWDAFTLPSNQAITEVHWRGGYDPAFFGSGGPVLDFTVAIYPNVTGGNEPAVLGAPLVQYTLGGNAGETPAGVFGGVQLYDYAFTLPAPFAATAGTKYWIFIKGWQNGITDWGLSAANGGDGSHFRRVSGPGSVIYQSVAGDAAFTLLAPEPVQAAAWAFDEGAGQVVSDGINGLAGQLGSASAADANDPVFVAGHLGTALQFGGMQYAVVPPSPALAPGTITLEAWVRRASVPAAGEYLVARGFDSTCTKGAYALRTGSGGGVEFVVFNAAGTPLVSPQSTSGLWNGGWHFVTGTFDGLRARLYVDGVQAGSGTASGSPFVIDYALAPDQRFAIGSYLGAACGPGSASFAGEIDQVAVWNGALNGAAVAQRFIDLSVVSTTTTNLTTTPSGATLLGEPVLLTATVTSTGGTPNGTVEFFDGTTSLGIATLGSGEARLVIDALAAGSHALSASYTPTGAFNPSTSATVVHTVSSVKFTTCTLASSLNPSVYSQSVRLTATVSAPAGGAVTGSVQFYDGTTKLGTATLSGGLAHLSKSTLLAGVHTLTATLPGTTSFASCTTGPLAQAVMKASTATVLSASPTSTTYFESVTLTATVANVAPASGVVKGKVAFYDGAVLLGTAALSSGRAVLITPKIGAGTRSVSAQYVGDANHNPSTSAGLAITVAQAATSTTVVSSVNPASVGISMYYLATVVALPPGAGPPTGSVKFYDNGVLIGTKTLNVSGQAKLPKTYKAPGSHTVIAVFQGSSNYLGSTSGSITQLVQ